MQPLIVDDITDLVNGTGDPAFAIDLTHTIVAWNHAAERLLDYRAADVIGRNCSQIIGGRNGDGQIICSKLCACLLALRRNDPPSHIDLQVRRRNGAMVWVSMSSILLTPTAPYVVHILRDITGHRNREAFVQQVLQATSALEPDPKGRPSPDGHPVYLSPRETEILRLLATGAGTRAIAEALSISPATVRNHIQQVMTTLQAHSRLEAVVRALQRRLL